MTYSTFKTGIICLLSSLFSLSFVSCESLTEHQTSSKDNENSGNPDNGGFMQGEMPPEDEIWYTTIDGERLLLPEPIVTDAIALSHSYENGVWKIKLSDSPRKIYRIDESCARLTSLALPAGIADIPAEAFYEFRFLTSIASYAETVGSMAFLNCDALTNVELPYAKVISGGAFAGCNALTSLKLPSVTTIEDGWLDDFGVDYVRKYRVGAFAYCNNLTDIDIPSATRIGAYAFYNSYAATGIRLPSVTYIGTEAFNRDYYSFTGYGDIPIFILESIYIESTTPPHIDRDAFPHDIAIYIPRNSLDIYKETASWEEYASQLVGYDF